MLVPDTQAVKILEELLVAVANLFFILLGDDLLPTHHFLWLLSSVENNLFEQEPELGIVRLLFEA